MLEKRTVVDQIELRADGLVTVRLAIEVVEDGKVISSRWHRTAIPQDVDAGAQMGAVNSHLGQLGVVEVPDREVQRLKRACAAHRQEFNPPI